MPKDEPIRNPNLSPSGLSHEELHRHDRALLPSPPGGPQGNAERCGFISSYGGVHHCVEAPYLEGFCEFHYGCLQRGEISPMGRIMDIVKDQGRRREINMHGIPVPQEELVREDPLTGDRRETGS